MKALKKMHLPFSLSVELVDKERHEKEEPGDRWEPGSGLFNTGAS